MAEAEDLITDVARHATVYAQRLWHRHRKPADAPRTITLADVAPRLDLFITSVFGKSHPLKTAQLPPRPTVLARLLGQHQRPYLEQRIPATDGHNIWLPADSLLIDRDHAYQFYCIMALQQAMRIERGSALLASQGENPLVADIYLLLEAYAADEALAKLLPGITESLTIARTQALTNRPPLVQFSTTRRGLENLLRRLLESRCGQRLPDIPLCSTPAQSLAEAAQLVSNPAWKLPHYVPRLYSINPLLKDNWTGELRDALPVSTRTRINDAPPEDDAQNATKTSHLARRPEVREADPDEDDNKDPGVWMIQGDEPHKHAEDPLGLQRPIDRDDETGAEEYADLVSELAEARLISTPGRPKEVLLSDDPPEVRALVTASSQNAQDQSLNYPEWDYRTQTYQNPGASVRILFPPPGSQQWVEQTLAEHQSLLLSIRRHFEMLRARRIVQRKQLDGEEIDLDAYIDSQADFHAGSPRSEACYQTSRTIDRNIAITLVIDVSGSTDGWISTHRRVIDVEKEALLLVCIALEGLGEPYSVLAFSGNGRNAVSVREIKRFDEVFNNEVALKISALEPERYTRAGAALRHATAQLMRMPAAHRLLLLLSDGKPNDDYEGRYGVEDMKKAVTEAKLQNIFSFCLTVDRQAANYLPGIFGKNQYALLARPEHLPRVLLDWLKRLITA